jgi:hypothetical protein
MGEASRRKQRRAEAVLTGKPMAPPEPVQMFENITVLVPKAVATELRAELAVRRKQYPKLDQADYAAALLESAVERERQMREAQTAEASLVQAATPAQVARVLSTPAAVGKRTPR